MLPDSSWCIHKRWNWCHPRHLQSNEQLTVAADAGPKVMPWPALNSNNSQSPKGIPGKGTPIAREASAAKGDRRGRRGLSLKAHCQKSISFHNCGVHCFEDTGVTWCLSYPCDGRNPSQASMSSTCGRVEKKGKIENSPEVWSWPCGARQLGARASPPRARGGAPFLMRYVSW